MAYIYGVHHHNPLIFLESGLNQTLGDNAQCLYKEAHGMAIRIQQVTGSYEP